MADLDDDPTKDYKLTSRQVNTILAALRTYQDVGDINDGITDISTNGGDEEPLEDEDINDLCEYLNCHGV